MIGYAIEFRRPFFSPQPAQLLAASDHLPAVIQRPMNEESLLDFEHQRP